MNSIKLIIEKLKCKKNRETTNKNYLSIWRQFNQFIMRLDMVPHGWEDRVVLFCVHLVEKGLQSSTIKSYISTIKCVLQDNNYDWNENQMLLLTITIACRLQNDRVFVHRPIKRNLLKVLLFELVRLYAKQPYLLIAFRVLFALVYYSLFRIRELATGDHPIKACDVHIGVKLKILYFLRTSKTHGLESRPQKVKICAEQRSKILHFCPF